MTYTVCDGWRRAICSLAVLGEIRWLALQCSDWNTTIGTRSRRICLLIILKIYFERLRCVLLIPEAFSLCMGLW